jgi:hypothetical protein
MAQTTLAEEQGLIRPPRAQDRIVDEATRQGLERAEEVGATNVWDRFEMMQPQCGFGRLGLWLPSLPATWLARRRLVRPATRITADTWYTPC